MAVFLGAMTIWGHDLASIAQADIVSGAVHQYDASKDADGDSFWEDLGTQADRDWTLFGPNGPNPSGPTRFAVSSATTITHAYNFDGVDDAAITSPENRSGNHDATFEFWFRPDQYPTGDVRPIFESGNSPRGLSFGLLTDTLLFTYGAGFTESGELAFDLSAIGINDFIQVVGVIDDTNDQMRLYINGGNEQTLSIGANNDFTSNRENGLASNQDGGGGQENSAFTWSGFYDGDIALLREYRFAFSLEEVQQNFAAISSPGDYDGDIDVDGDVDGADFLLWQRGDSPNPLSATDLALWEENFGSPSLTVAAAIVPEPSTVTLACSLLALISLHLRLRSRRVLGVRVELSPNRHH